MTKNKNTPTTVSEATALGNTMWEFNGERREIIRVEGAVLSQYDHRTVLADVYWRKEGEKERSKPTPLTTFRTWLNKAKLISH